MNATSPFRECLVGHERNIIRPNRTGDLPLITVGDKLKVEKAGELISCFVITFGCMASPDVPRALALAMKCGLIFEPKPSSFLPSRRNVLEARESKMPRWQDKPFIGRTRDANHANRRFKPPADRVVELDTHFATWARRLYAGLIRHGSLPHRKLMATTPIS